MGRFDFEIIPKSILRLLITDKTKCESGFLFNTKMPVVLRVRDCVLVTMVAIKPILRLLITSML